MKFTITLGGNLLVTKAPTKALGRFAVNPLLIFIAVGPKRRTMRGTLDYKVGDLIRYRRTDGTYSVCSVKEKLPNGFIGEERLPQYTHPIHVLVHGEDIVGLETVN